MSTDGRDDAPADGPPIERRTRPKERRTGETSLDLAFVDDLTGLPNRRYLTHLFTEGWSDFVSRHLQAAFILIDLDRFKEVNDRYGHLAGDGVLRTTARLLCEHFREEDVVVRYGGDEFLVLLPDAGEAVAGALADRARRAVDTHPFAAGEEGERIAVPLSFSMGVASYPADGAVGVEVIDAADRRLYEEKRRRSGRRDERERPMTAALALGLAVVALVAALATALGWFGVRPEPPRGTMPRSGALERERLEGQIRELEGRVESLSRALSEEAGTRRREAEYEQTVRQLQEQIQRLQEQMPRPPAPASAQPEAPLATAAPSTAPDAHVRASQEQPLVERSRQELGRPEPRTAPRHEPPPVLTVTRPILLRFLAPPYPTAAFKLRREAVIEVRVLVDETGRALSAAPAGPLSGLGFEEAAVQAALSARFRPGTRGGVPVKMEATVAIRFQLDR